MATSDKTRERDLYIVRELRKGHSRRWVAAQLQEKYGYTELTARDYVNQIGAELNRSLKELTEEAADYIYNNLLATIDDSIEKDSRKDRIKALELLSKVCKVGSQEENQEIHIHLDFDK